ncbi:hypothetical protein [Thalassospira sp. HJ]|uniref:hypothetical protein n=1 Tax=Thalassospira sp. HJ TaxID=1616823 RepID=UPI000AA1FC12|nr:hypothetical protein [Thalassospira sp. HJ]
MTIMANQAEQLARIGCNIEIPANTGYLANQVENIIRIASSRGAHVTVHAGRYLPNQLEHFARIGRDKVTIVL